MNHRTCPAWCTSIEADHARHTVHIGGTGTGPEWVMPLQGYGEPAEVFLGTGTGDDRQYAFLSPDAVPAVAAALRLGATATTRELADLLDRAAQLAGGVR